MYLIVFLLQLPAMLFGLYIVLWLLLSFLNFMLRPGRKVK